MPYKHSHLFMFPLLMSSITILAGLLATIPSTSAEDITPVDDEINITVDSACTMGIISSSSITGIVPGETKDIGAYRMAAYCNDSNGYDIYAIGYTNGEYGNTNMISTNGDIISTGTSGEDSYWNMRLTPGTATDPITHIPTIVSPFTNNTAIPDDYTKVVTYPSITIPQGTDPTESGSYFTALYQAHASTTLPAGTYKGQVQYVMVHPTTAPKPIVPYMQTVSQWKDQLLPNINDTIQAIDKRDGKKYWVTKLADGNIWMTQNLDLDIDANKTYTSADTDLPEGSIWKPSISTYTDNTWASSETTPESYNPGNRYWYGNIGRGSGTIEDNTTPTGDPHYHLGNYYNWTAAVAMNDSSDYIADNTDSRPDQSICPVGWGISSGSFSRLHLTSGVNGNVQIAPTYLIYGGMWNGYSELIGERGYHWYSLNRNATSAYYLVFNDSGYVNYYSYGARSNGFGIRCVTR